MGIDKNGRALIYPTLQHKKRKKKKIPLKIPWSRSGQAAKGSGSAPKWNEHKHI